METITIAIPYFVLSTQQHMDGRRQVHALTPFGCIDISVKLIDAVRLHPLLDVSVEGDLGPWMMDRRMPNEFRDAIFNLAGNIALSRNGCAFHRRCRLRIHFKEPSGQLTMSGYMNPAESRRQSEIPQSVTRQDYHWPDKCGALAPA